MLKNYLWSHNHHTIIHYSQDIETILVSLIKRMDKENYRYIYTYVYNKATLFEDLLCDFDQPF
jgi:hypothetical protein